MPTIAGVAALRSSVPHQRGADAHSRWRDLRPNPDQGSAEKLPQHSRPLTAPGWGQARAPIDWPVSFRREETRKSEGLGASWSSGTLGHERTGGPEADAPKDNNKKAAGTGCRPGFKARQGNSTGQQLETGGSRPGPLSQDSWGWHGPPRSPPPPPARRTPIFAGRGVGRSSEQAEGRRGRAWTGEEEGPTGFQAGMGGRELEAPPKADGDQDQGGTVAPTLCPRLVYSYPRDTRSHQGLGGPNRSSGF